MTVLWGLAARLKLARLQFLVEAGPDADHFAALVGAALAGGVDVVQVRRGVVAERTFAARIEQARTLARPTQALVVVHDDAALAGRLQADGLHLGGPRADVDAARRAVSRHTLLGRTVHESAQLTTALAQQLDYLLVGPDVALIADAAARAGQDDVAAPVWFAAGGVTVENLPRLWAAGARRVAVSTAIAQATDPRGAAREIASWLDQAWQADAAMVAYRREAVAAPVTGFVPTQQSTGAQR